MSKAQHVIRRLTFEVYIPSEEQGFNTQETISDLLNRILQSELEKLFDRLDDRSEVISIDRLEVDLGFIEENALEQDLPGKVNEHVEEKLRDLIISARMSNTGQVQVGEQKTSVSFKPADTSKLELLLHFLQTGTMPWWANNEEKSVSVLIVKLLEESPAKLREALEKIFNNASYRKRFIYQLADPLIAEVMKLYDRSFSGFAADSVNDICTIHSRNSFTSLSSQSLRLACWSYFIQQAMEKNTGSRVTEKARHLRALITQLQPSGDALLFVIRKARQLQDEQMLRTSDLADILVIAKKQASDEKTEEQDRRKPGRARGRSRKASIAGKEEEREKDNGAEETSRKTAKENKKARKAKSLKTRKHDPATKSSDEEEIDGITVGEDALIQNEPAKEGITKSAADKKDIRNNPPDANAPGNTGDELADAAKKRSEKDLLQEQLKKAFSIEDDEEITDVLADGIYIDNAGLVIVWPYLLPFFRKLELVNGNEFASEEAQHRAVHILQYLATGEETAAEEHELVLNKALCGIDPEEPVSSIISLSTAERNECEQLLDNIIANWAALKSISSSALRSTFLVKEGILKRENGWSLKIERTTVDMLIDRLPWGISIITLPWNKELIYAEW